MCSSRHLLNGTEIDWATIGKLFEMAGWIRYRAKTVPGERQSSWEGVRHALAQMTKIAQHGRRVT